MLLARFLRPGEVFEMEISDMGQWTETRNQYLLVKADKASKFLVKFPLLTKEAIGVAKAVLDVLLTFGLPVSLHSDPSTTFAAEPSRQVDERVFSSITNLWTMREHMRPLKGWTLVIRGAGRKVQDVATTAGCIRARGSLNRSYDTPDTSLPGKATPFCIFSGRDPRIQF